MKAHFDHASGLKSSRSPAGSRRADPLSLPKTALLWRIPQGSPAWGPLRAAERLGLALRVVAPADAQKTVAALCGISGAGGAGAARPAESLPADTPALILCGLPKAEREALLSALRAAGASIPLKAIVTPTNQGWRFAALLAELAREHAALSGG